MKILLDENIPIKLKGRLSDFDVYTVRDMNWDGFKNGELLKEAIKKGFDILITTDKNLQYQQNIRQFNLGIMILDVLLLKWSIIEPLIPKIIENIPLMKKRKLLIIK